MKTLIALGLLGMATISSTLAGCSADAGEDVGEDNGSAVSQSVDLKYEGTCNFLHSCSAWSRKLPAGQVLWGCTGAGACDDDALWVAGPYKSKCNKTVRICKGTRCVNALVKDISVSHSWEASNGVLDALGIPHHLFGQCSGGGGGRVTIDENPVNLNGGAPEDDGSCYSNTLDRSVPEKTCVVSDSNGETYQCSGGHWVSGVDNGEGPAGTCVDAN